MTLPGLLWVAFAPVGLLLMVVIGRLLLLRRMRARWGWPVAAATVLLPVAALWLQDHADFVRVCDGEGLPVVLRRAAADGVFLNSGTANSFGMRYLQEEGFAWVEAPSIHRRGSWVRYEKTAGESITTTEIDALTARYEVREVFSQPNGHTGLSQTQVIERSTGELLAKAGSATFDGGRAKWLLGAWGVRSCPSAMGSPASFNAYYHLAKNTLR